VNYLPRRLLATRLTGGSQHGLEERKRHVPEYSAEEALDNGPWTVRTLGTNTATAGVPVEWLPVVRRISKAW